MRHSVLAFIAVLGCQAAPTTAPAEPRPALKEPTPRLEPEPEAPPVAKLVVGPAHTCAVGRDGTVWCWGDNRFGELGDGSTEIRLAAVQVRDVTDAVDASLGPSHSCVLHGDGTVSCWGDNEDGQSGPEDTSRIDAPRKVSGITGVVELAAGSDSTCVRSEDGTVSCWGNGRGRWSPLPDAVEAVQIGTGRRFGCARTSEAEVWCWAPDDPDEVGRIEEVEDAIDLSVAIEHACAVTRAGKAWCWGSNNQGQLGVGTDERARGIVEVTVDGFNGLVTGGNTSCGQRDDGLLVCWGYGFGSQPVVWKDARQGAQLGGSHWCFATRSEIRCSGSNAGGQLGVGRIGAQSSERPLTVKGLEPVTQLAGGESFTCGLHADGTVSCWGSGRRGGLGSGSREDSSVPVKVVNLDDAVELYEGTELCARRKSGAIVCWGGNEEGQQLPTSQWAQHPEPVEVVWSGPATTIGTGVFHSCALLENGTVECMGNNQMGVLGQPGKEGSQQPVAVPKLRGIQALSVGGMANCVVDRRGQVSCWGWVVDEYVDDPHALRRVPKLSGAVDVSVGAQTCAQLDAGALECWDRPRKGKPIQRRRLFDAGVEEIAPGLYSTCVRMSDGGVKCWTRDAWRVQPDDGSRPLNTTQVPELTDAVELTAGADHYCARKRDGAVVCWGEGEHGALGQDSLLTSAKPLVVQGLDALFAGSG